MMVFKSGNKKVTLPNPDFGDATNVIRDVTVHVSRGGRTTTVLGAEINKDDVQTLLTDYSFTNVGAGVFDEFLLFLEETAGEKVFLEWEDETWGCIIMGDTFSYQENPLGFKCGGSYDFDVVVKRWL